MNPIEALERVATFEGYPSIEIFLSQLIKNFTQPKIQFFSKNFYNFRPDSPSTRSHLSQKLILANLVNQLTLDNLQKHRVWLLKMCVSQEIPQVRSPPDAEVYLTFKGPLVA